MRLTRRSVLIAGVFVPMLALSTWKVLEYAADPVGEKDCTPLDPTSASDSAQLNTIEAKATPAALPWAQIGGFINDASCLNKTAVYGVVQVKEVEDIRDALFFAKAHRLQVSLAGVRHSMGGQAFYKDAVVLDMTQFNKMSLDERHKVLTAQSGATWHDMQNFLHPKHAVKAMQSTDIFTVGGSISVNAHGMDHQVGAIGKTIRSMRLMLADGSITTLSRTENQELLKLVIGGYGLFGIIVDVALEVMENVLYHPGRRLADYKNFPDLFDKALAADKQLGLLYGHLSTAPHSLLQEMILYTYTEQAVPDAEIPPLTEVAHVKWRRFMLNFAKRGAIPMRIKWFAEKYLEPKMETCIVNMLNPDLNITSMCGTIILPLFPWHANSRHWIRTIPRPSSVSVGWL